jgi:uncharacterized membrane protein YfhO
MIEHRQNRIRGRVTLDKKQLLFFSIPFDVGWSAVVDGKQASLELVDFGLTGILLDKGEHSVELRFRPRFLTLGMIVSSAAMVTFVGLLLWPIFKRRRESENAGLLAAAGLTRIPDWLRERFQTPSNAFQAPGDIDSHSR